jgi:hypothetical protein
MFTGLKVFLGSFIVLDVIRVRSPFEVVKMFRLNPFLGSSRDITRRFVRFGVYGAYNLG